MPLTKKTFLLLAISSAFLALATLLHQVETARSRALEEQKRELAGAAQQLTQLTRDIGRYEAARGQLGQSGVAGRTAPPQRSADPRLRDRRLPAAAELLAPVDGERRRRHGAVAGHALAQSDRREGIHPVKPRLQENTP